jgi:hypothetical protein
VEPAEPVAEEAEPRADEQDDAEAEAEAVEADTEEDEEDEDERAGVAASAPAPAAAAGAAEGSASARATAAPPEAGEAPPRAPAHGPNGSPSSPLRPGEIPPALSSVPRATPAQSARPRTAAPLRSGSSSSSQIFTARQPGGSGGAGRVPPGAAKAGDSRSPAPRAVALAGIAVLVAAALVFAGTQIFGGGSEEPAAPNQAGETSTAEPAGGTPSAEGERQGSGADRPAPARPDRRGTTVAVLNGTFSAGLAGTTAEKVARVGYKRGTTGNFTDQNRSASVIYYADGARTEARDVGKILKISDVQPMDSQTEQVGEGAAVVVVTGSDQAP